jgi:hypothetical protein
MSNQSKIAIAFQMPSQIRAESLQHRTIKLETLRLKLLNYHRKINSIMKNDCISNQIKILETLLLLFRSIFSNNALLAKKDPIKEMVVAFRYPKVGIFICKKFIILAECYFIYNVYRLRLLGLTFFCPFTT